MDRRTEMDDVERHTGHGHGDPVILRKKTQQPACQCFCFCMVVIVTLVMTACVLVPILYYSGDARYSVAIDSAYLNRPMTAAGLSFNLTLGVASHSHGSKSCIGPGTYAEVYYHGVQLAASPPQAGRLCAGPRKAAEKRVLAMATGVPLGRVMDSLMADMKQEAAVFDVAMHMPAGSYDGMASTYYGVKVKWVLTCEGMRLGAAPAMCDSSPDQEELFA